MSKASLLNASILTAVLLPGVVSAQPASPRTSDPVQLRQQLWNLINNGDTRRFQTPGILAASPFYRQTSGSRPPWHLFPASGLQPADAFLNRRLGLPVHGRWVSTYVNVVSFECLKNRVGCAPANAQQVRLAAGAIVVKENYSNVSSPRTVAQRLTPGVITVLWKPFAGYCGSRLPYNGPRRDLPEGPDCLGGEWLYAFYILQNPHLDEAGVRRYDALVTADDNAQGFCINCHAPAFRADYLRGLLAQWRQTIPGTPQMDEPAVEELSGEPFCRGTLMLTPELPTDVALDPKSILSPDLRQQMFDCFSWRSFVALNWPGRWDRRGEPDRGRSFGSFAGPEAPAVWQTYRATWEVFQPERGPSWVPPSQFNGPRPVPQGNNCPAGTDALAVTRPVLTMISKSRVGGRDGDIGNETGQAFAGQFGTLADRNGRLVRYEVSMNAAEFAYLVNNGFARNASLTPGGPRGVDASFPDGSVEVKAAWKELCLDRGCIVRDDPSRYFTRPVLIYDEASRSCDPKPRLMGLVGLHIAQKTPRAPQWIWSTFEHVDNVPSLAGDEVDPEVSLAPARFNDPSCRAQENFCFWRPFLAGMGLNPSPCCPNVTLNRFPGFGFFDPDGRPTSNQLTRLDPIQGSGLNQRFQQVFASSTLADTPFRYYVLVSTQWPLNGRDAIGRPNTRRCSFTSDDGERPQQVGPNCYTLVPEVLRNSVIESYMADYYNDMRGRPVQRSNRSCMGCHGDAGTDFSYIFLDAVEQRVPIQVAPGGSQH